MKTSFDLDSGLQALAGNLGAPRVYFDLRDYLRARFKTVDTALMREKRAIFVHVPKCAGTTIVRQAPIAAWHFSAGFMRRHSPELWGSAFTFGFARDPHDRLVSAFHYLRSDKAHPRDRRWGQANLREFADFAAFMAALDASHRRARLLAWLHFLPQTYYLCDRQDRVLVDFVGRTEQFATGLEQINARSGLRLENRHENRTERPAEQAFYTPQTARLVEDIFAADFATFGYPTGRY